MANDYVCLFMSSSAANQLKCDCWTTRRHRQALGKEEASLLGCCVKCEEKKTKQQLHLPSHLKTSRSSAEAHCTAAWEHVLVCYAKAVAPRQQLSSHGHHGETKQDVCVCQCVSMCVRGLWSIMCPAHPLLGCPIQYAQPDCLFPTRESL